MKSMIFKSATVALLAIAMVGCATTSKKSPEELILESVNAWQAAIVAQDVEAAGAQYSDNFSHVEWGDKTGAIGFLEQAKSAGYLDGIEIVSSAAEVKVDGDSATVYPIDLKGSFGAVTMELKYTNEDGTWAITGTDASGM